MSRSGAGVGGERGGARWFPQILAALLAPVVSGENVGMLLGRCSGFTKRQAEEVVVEVAPRKAFDDSARKKLRGVEKKTARAERAREQGAAKPTVPAQPRPDDVPAPSPSTSPSPSRHIPPALRDRVFSRAAHRCQYVAADGTRCPSRTRLQVEHREPFAVSRSHAEDNVEALCPAHNGLREREYFGSERIQDAIAGRRQATSSRTMLGTSEPQHRLDDV